MSEIRISDALQSLRPNSEYSVTGDAYSGLNWLDKTQTKPTEQEVEERIAVLKYQEEVNVYQEKRKLEYPNWGDQLDQIYHSGIDVWKSDIKKIKDKYPKQTMDPNELLNRKKVAVFEMQKRNYKVAVARLAEYELSEGVKDENGHYVIEPLPLYVEGVGRNPLIVQDEAERRAAQRVIDNSPQAVIDSVSS
jgi:hypothetical protein